MKKPFGLTIASLVIVLAFIGCGTSSTLPQGNSQQNSIHTQNQTSTNIHSTPGTVTPLNRSVQSVQYDNSAFTSLDDLKKIYTVTWDYNYGGASGADIVIQKPYLNKFIIYPDNQRGI